MTNTIHVKRGDTFACEIQCLDFDDNPVDLTGYSMSSQVRHKTTDAVIATIIVTPDPDQATNTGWCTLTTADLTGSWPLGVFDFDIEAVDPDGHADSTLTCDFWIQKDVTR